MWCIASPASHTPVFLAVHSFSPVSVGVVREHGDGGGERTIATDGGAGDDGCGRREHEREPRVEIHTYPHPPPAPTSIIYGACLYYTTKMGLARITITESLNSVAAP